MSRPNQNKKQPKAKNAAGKGKRRSSGNQGAADKLTEKQRAFCAEYLVDLNATQAAIRAGYSKATARQIGQENLSKPDIQEEIQRLLAERSARVEITADTVLRELMKLACVDIGQAFDENGNLLNIADIPEDVRKAIAGVDVFDEFEGVGENRERIGQTKKVRFWDKTKALEMLGRHLRLFADKLELTGKNGGPVQTQVFSAETDKEIADCMADIRASLRAPGT